MVATEGIVLSTVSTLYYSSTVLSPNDVFQFEESAHVDLHIYPSLQRTNVAGITSLVNRITTASSRISPTSALAGPHARFGCLSSALEGASAPSIAPIKTTNKSVSLVLGDPDAEPGQSLDVRVCLQKAVQKAATQSMGRMRRGAWNRSLRDDIKSKNGAKEKRKGRKRRAGSGEDEDAEEASGSEEDDGVYRPPGEIVNERVMRWSYI